MKTLTCDLCDATEQGETFEQWMEALKPHYAQAHASFMKEQGGKSPEEQKAEMQKWMADNKARFDAA
ncbi:MAG: hypothetical protein COU35_04855 [Candidatus Magasanikbacteria bacterium CG10_big_fil_rev_8_21_14_0_10_47_10]|uniref:Uncharacterized protein n=1 Tax=Candidatus Magasanikbacteria bacterium CG10_big_fil_rev_8_21_14_0_10_47_10 TaxID=1974652 RepID=A0A2H0TPC3_9BACT|nr:MAG: hypothetical protein COU35_04855 [Candidatus Magasanikbacteria bacterium CG10_big_fil_rev_8_21_14_0_10_47_10]